MKTTARAHDATGDVSSTARATVMHAHHPYASRTASARRFVRHLAEMVLAMWVGMAVFGGLRAVLADSTPVAVLRDHLDFRLVAMALFMAVPMAALMRVREHPWERVAEMVGAMVIPVAVVCLLWHFDIGSGVWGLTDDTLAASSHALMYGGMLLAMVGRFDEYAHVGPHMGAAHG